jgi:hypothetical protein
MVPSCATRAPFPAGHGTGIRQGCYDRLRESADDNEDTGLMGYRVRIFLRDSPQGEGMYIGERIVPFPPRRLDEVSFEHLGRNQRAVIEQIAPSNWNPNAESIPVLHVVAVARGA